MNGNISFFLTRGRRKQQLFHGSWHVLIFCGTQIVQSNMFQYLLLAIVKGLEEGVGFVVTWKGKEEELDFCLNFLRCFFHKELTNSLQTHSHRRLERIAFFESQLKGPIVYYVPRGVGFRNVWCMKTVPPKIISHENCTPP